MDTPHTDTALWAVHVEGPDSIIAQPDRDTAVKCADEINAAYVKFTQRPDHDPDLDARWNAVVVEWDGTAAEHAEELARLADDPDIF